MSALSEGFRTRRCAMRRLILLAVRTRIRATTALKMPGCSSQVVTRTLQTEAVDVGADHICRLVGRGLVEQHDVLVADLEDVAETDHQQHRDGGQDAGGTVMRQIICQRVAPSTWADRTGPG